MKFKKWISKILFILLTITMLPVCVAGEPKISGFMDQKNMTMRGDLPFEMAWIKPGVHWAQYKKMVILPVDTRYLMKSNFWQEMGRTEEEIEKDVKNLAIYTRLAFQRAFFEDFKRRFKITLSTAPSPDTLKVEMALTELTPNKVLLKAAGYVPLYGLAAKAVNQTNPSYVSIEIRLKDARTGEILAKFSDRQKEPFSIVNIDDFSWYGFAEKRVDQWAVKFVETLNRKPGEVVSKSSAFELKPW